MVLCCPNPIQTLRKSINVTGESMSFMKPNYITLLWFRMIVFELMHCNNAYLSRHHFANFWHLFTFLLVIKFLSHQGNQFIYLFWENLYNLHLRPNDPLLYLIFSRWKNCSMLQFIQELEVTKQEFHNSSNNPEFHNSTFFHYNARKIKNKGEKKKNRGKWNHCCCCNVIAIFSWYILQICWCYVQLICPNGRLLQSTWFLLI